MKEDFLVSIAMCTYNGERFIKEQLESILSQSYKNLEIIITDDCSCDNTREIIKNFSLKDSRIKYFFNEKNLGFIKNFEKSISLCTGDYIALSDQDDIWVDEKIEIFLDKIRDSKLIYSDALLIDDKSNFLQDRLIVPHKNPISGSSPLSFLFTNCVSGNTLMFERTLLKDILPMHNNLAFHDTWIALIASTKGSIVYHEKPLTLYRRYDDQVTVQREGKYKNVKDRLVQKEKLLLKDAHQKHTLYLEYLRVKKDMDSNLLNTIILLEEHYLNFERSFFNFKLFFILFSNRKEIFKIRKRSILKNIFKISLGLKIQRILFFSI